MQRRAARFVKSKYSRYSGVSDMLDVLGWPPLSQRRQEALLIPFFTIVLTVWHKCPSNASVLRHIRVLKENTTLNLDRLTIPSMDIRVFPKTISAWNGLAFAEAPSLAVFRSNFLNN